MKVTKYTTRDGCEVDGPYEFEPWPDGDCPGKEHFYGYVKNTNGWIREEWYAGGKYYNSDEESPFDLIPVPEPKLLNYDTFPRDVCWVRCTGERDDLSVLRINREGIVASFIGLVPWERLRSYEVWLNGEWVRYDPH